MRNICSANIDQKKPRDRAVESCSNIELSQKKKSGKKNSTFMKQIFVFNILQDHILDRKRMPCLNIIFVIDRNRDINGLYRNFNQIRCVDTDKNVFILVFDMLEMVIRDLPMQFPDSWGN